MTIRTAFPELGTYLTAGIPLSTADKEYDAQMEEAIAREEEALHWSGDVACALLFDTSLWAGGVMTAVAEAHGPRASDCVRQGQQCKRWCILRHSFITLC